MEELIKKLRYKKGQALIINAPEGYSLGIEADLVPKGAYDFAQIFVHTQKETIKHFSEILPYLNEDALLWVTYPKKSSKIKSDINRDVLREMLEQTSDYRTVSLVAVDDKWSALRLRHKDKIKSKN